ncbi:Hypothetical predicted protein [Paramuricea clavata]|uniref:Uncharacterized protein n=1 Tax=Paramuricea clavata TaxID=317549 RepID=A0A7D9E913_PARCT|nr:Hypothetical predicted protein [Paramuricea clavata]
MVYPLPKKSTIVIEVGSTYTVKPTNKSTPEKILSDVEKSKLDEELKKLNGSKLRKEGTQTTKLKSVGVVKWLWRIECGYCKKSIMLRYDSDSKGRINAFQRLNDGLSSSDDFSISSHITDKDIPIDSDDQSECQSSGSAESNLDDINGDVNLDEDNRWYAYSVDKADPVCRKFDDLICRGLVPKNGILYKYLSDVIEIFYDRCHSYDREVVEFFNTIRHLGGWRTQQAGCTIRSGVIKSFCLSQLKLATNNSQTVPIIASDIVHVIPCNNGNAIKPSIEFDSRLKRCVGLDIDVDTDFVKRNDKVTLEFLSEHIVTEVVISSVTTIDNEVSLPCMAEYVPKSGKIGEAISKSLLLTIKTLQICELCVKKIAPIEHILKYTNICESRCDACLLNNSLCEECKRQGHTSHLPCLRACVNCLERCQLCVRRVFLVLTADCEEGNKAAFRIIKKSIEDGSIDPDLCLLSPIPDVPRMGKSLKAGFSNWYLKLAEERSNLAVIRNLRNRSTDTVKQCIRKLIPKSDHVRNRDRQDPCAVLTLTNDSLLAYLSSLGLDCTTIIPETCKFTPDNRPGMYPKPISVALGSYDTFCVVKKQIQAKEVHFLDGIVYLCGDHSHITILDEGRLMNLDVKKLTSKAQVKAKCKDLDVPLDLQSSVAQMKERLTLHKKNVEKPYGDNGFETSTINFWNDNLVEQTQNFYPFA